ncbi:MAG: hypothetical protein JXQ87_11700 [Bacteroidia bacterium]
MKHFLFSTMILSSFLFNACNSNNCDDAPAFSKCQESPENNPTACQAVWSSWIYDESTGTCSKRSYSGCEPLGFETQEACEECDCYRLETNR